jgi:uncharacterized protein YjbI with pentapeptide repeats
MDDYPMNLSWLDRRTFLSEPVRVASCSMQNQEGERVSRVLQEANIPFWVTNHLGWYFDVREEDHERAFRALARDAREHSYLITLSLQSVPGSGRPARVVITIGSCSIGSTLPDPGLLPAQSSARSKVADAPPEGANLAGCDLRHAKLADQILVLANLQGASMSHADLRVAILCFADLRGADLQAADLRGANLSAVYAYNRKIEGRVWGLGASGAQLQGASLEGADLQAAALWGADLSGANLRRANLRQADFAGTHLSPDERAEVRRWAHADLPRTDLTDADLMGADLRGALYNSDTRWPVGFDPREHGAELVPQTSQS